MHFEGTVVSQLTDAGSKSERQAVLLQTDHGLYVLRRKGGNPFHDPDLVKLVGKTIAAEGDLHAQTLLMDSCRRRCRRTRDELEVEGRLASESATRGQAPRFA